jgi:antirestriction protein ArdC
MQKDSKDNERTAAAGKPMPENRWQQILLEAVNQPGSISTAYRAFHGYSFGNRLLALAQCLGRGIEPGLINTYRGWQAIGRQVKRGEKALELCMPVTCRAKEKTADGESESLFTRFVFKSNWFVLAQTTGDEAEFTGTIEWKLETALAKLDVQKVPFAELNGNVQGYARKREFAVSPVAALPHKTTFHELAHIVLGHTAQGDLADDSTRTPKNLREVEAETVALILCESLDLPGAEFARGYIQSWLRQDHIPETSARNILTAADTILKAGTAT